MAAALLTLIAVQGAGAQQSNAASGADAEFVKLLLKRIEELESRVKELEAKQPRVSPSSSEPDRVVEKSDKQIEEPRSEQRTSSDGLPSSLPALRLQGFGDVEYRASGAEPNTFRLGQLDLFITSRLSERWSVLVETVIEANDKNGFGIDLERLLLQYSPSDYFNLGVGRYHSSIGFYNTAYHHGTWFQTATGRPTIFAFEDEGGILPIHNVGVTVNGRIPSGRLGLRYFAEIGNGRASALMADHVQTVMDENNGKAFNFGLLARPETVPGLQAGFSLYRDRLTPAGSPNVGETIGSAHVTYQSPAFELLNEAIAIRHALNGTGNVFNTFGFYTQVARQFGKARPYFRYQLLNTPDGDPIYAGIGRRRSGPSFGLRYDVDEFAAFKIQYDRSAERRLAAMNALTLQLAFTF